MVVGNSRTFRKFPKNMSEFFTVFRFPNLGAHSVATKRVAPGWVRQPLLIVKLVYTF